jgi:phosphoglycerate kinase
MTKKFLTLDDFDLEDKTVLLRVDINSPIDPATGKFLDETRIQECTSTINKLSRTKLAVIAHQSNPGKKDFTSLEEHAKILEKHVKRKVKFVDDLFGSKARDAIKSMKKGDIILLENCRFYSEEVSLADKPVETQKKSQIVKKLSPLADYYVNDAFAAAHRAQPTLTGFSETIPMLTGLLMERELTMLGKAVEGAKRPTIALLGGAKVDDSVDVALNMLKNGIADKILTTGVVANMFMYVNGVDIGKPNVEFMKKELGDFDETVAMTKEVLGSYKEKILMPVDVALNDNEQRKEIPISRLPTDKPIFDLGKNTISEYIHEIKRAGTTILNGPAGVFETEAFSAGTYELFKAVANSKGYSVMGGGHTGVIVEKLNLAKSIGHVSTGGGACLNFLAGKKMPVVEALKRSKQLYDEGYFKKKP